MRLAKLHDFRRRLRECANSWPVKFDRFAFENIPGAGTGEIPLHSPIVVLAGPNGAGKTTLLRALWTAAAPDSATLGASMALKLSAGTATLEFRQAGTILAAAVSFSSGQISGKSPLTTDVIHLDAAFDAKRLQGEFCLFENVEDIINGVGARTLGTNELAEVNYIGRREYREIKIYETESHEDAAPFFEVALGNDRYDSRTMGAGELALLYLWWAVERAPQQALLLLEEPETYLSPASQEAISHFILKSTVEKQLNVIITSHSAKIIGNFDEANLVFLFRDGAGIKVAEGSVPPVLWENIGLLPQIDVVVLVEDEAAKNFLRQMLERHSPTLSRRLEICDKNGDGNIIAALKSMGGASKAIHLVGMFDGDLVERIPEEVAPFSAFLPGDRPIEKIFQDLVQSNPERLGTAIGSAGVPAILYGLQGADHHDWYARLCEQLGLSRDQLFPTLFRLWHEDPNNADLAKHSIEALAALL